MFNLTKLKPATYILPKEGGMRVPGLIIANERLLQEGDIEKPLDQVRHVAYLEGIVGYSIAMPDIHWGYGFPIGGVAATDVETGVISPGGVGYDINCGVRVAVLPLQFKDLDKKKRTALLEKIFQLVPSGVGHGHKHRRKLNESDYRHLTELGAAWSIKQGYGFTQDLEHMESRGVIEGADMGVVSAEAQRRGADQLGSIGSGNHFVEIGEVTTLYLPDIAQAWGVEKGQTYILIHSGSRGFGYQICQDTLNQFVRKGFAEGLPDKQLVAAPFKARQEKNILRPWRQRPILLLTTGNKFYMLSGKLFWRFVGLILKRFV